MADGAALIAELEEITGTVGARYDALIQASQPASRMASGKVAMPAQEDIEDISAALGFADADALAARIRAWESGTLRALRSDAARGAFTAIRPALLSALASAPEPERALARWEQLLANLPSAINLFRLLEARPGLLDLLGRILSIAPTLADALARRADLLDPLIDASAFDLPGTTEELVSAFSRRETGDDYERTLGRVRRKVGELRFLLGVQLIEGRGDPLDIGAALARIAEAALQVLTDAACTEFRARHGTIAGQRTADHRTGQIGRRSADPRL